MKLDPEKLPWYQVLKFYRTKCGGVGLSPTSLSYLTGTPYSQIREEFLELRRNGSTAGKHLNTDYCDTVRAWLMIYAAWGGIEYDAGWTKHCFQQLDEQTEAWPAPKYQGVRNKKGQLRLTVHRNTVNMPKLKEFAKAGFKDNGDATNA